MWKIKRVVRVDRSAKASYSLRVGGWDTGKGESDISLKVHDKTVIRTTRLSCKLCCIIFTFVIKIINY